MGLFKTEYCAICNEEIDVFAGIKLNTQEKICKNCLGKMNLTSGYTINNVKNSSIEQLKERISFVEKDLSENTKRINSFTPTTQIGNYIWFDDNNKWFAIPQGTFKCTINNSYVFSYSSILNFELLEDGNTISKGGTGRAVVGGALFGGVGAIVGATTGSKKSQTICTKLQIKITTNNQDRPLFYINFINGVEYKKNSFLYKQLFDNAQSILSKLQIITNELNKQENIQETSLSLADEIKKYKELLDTGAITQEEFESIKKKLL